LTFNNNFQEFVYIRSYSRWIEDLNRREKWPETIDRYINFLKEERGDKIPSKVLKKIKHYMLNLEVMPSMRLVWAAGEAARLDNTCGYNCSFAAVDGLEAFNEAMYILMCGTGYGFSVQNKFVVQSDKLPKVPIFNGDSYGTHIVPDSRKGWADSVKLQMNSLFNGKTVEFDYSKIREKCARLIVMGGRASGPAPLIKLHNFIQSVFEAAQGRKLTTLECHDILNEIAEIVVVGGVRRSSEMSLSDLFDMLMKTAKVHPFPLRRHMANNSAVYETKPTAVEFLKEWSVLAESGTGERGIFNLYAAKKRTPKRRNSDLLVGTNPCSEILLRTKEFCNLSEIVVRAGDDLDDLLEKIECAVWIGSIQSTFTYFPYLSPEWKKNCEEERLLGVSLTGQMDNPSMMTPDNLTALKKKAIKIAKKASKILEINMPAAITCSKPSGTVSQLVDSASGLHPRYSHYYIRRYRISSTDPLFKLCKDQKVPYSPEIGERKKDWNKAKKIYEGGGKNYLNVCKIFEPNKVWSEDKVNTFVLDFYVKSPENALVRTEVNAIAQLEYYKKLQKYWCEHNASCTVYVKDDEWFEVGNWVYKNWDDIVGVSFLPYDGGKYELAPYEEITQEQYEEFESHFPDIDFSKLSEYEKDDHTQGSKTLACTGDKCEI